MQDKKRYIAPDDFERRIVVDIINFLLFTAADKSDDYNRQTKENIHGETDCSNQVEGSGKLSTTALFPGIGDPADYTTKNKSNNMYTKQY